ncbi:hypothetical protein BDK51DRAFT_51359 [Blyttiomyces helicus]|uniref:MYND-type domain-containing protein n=1 Tax=Blyttiomyces helicus TaxID=388810 RepID=A0A4P9VUE9_9FUNG|nr:hypothetical protein BDK51DRAFT_51359 [Blyttiomyces helicus]|eukprot:RKO82702.1 hypothetical protein BDK51DRAFT_51359 [Blyttiomyces helicus]
MHGEPSGLIKFQAATEAGSRGDWRASADTFRASFEEAFAEKRFMVLYAFTAIFRNNWLQPSASDLAFMRRILQSELEPVLHRAYCANIIGLLIWRQGDLKAAAQRYRRGIALASSATEAYRQDPIIFKYRYSCTGEAIDELLDDMRINLDFIGKQLSMVDPLAVRARPKGSFAFMKMMIATRAADCENYRVSADLFRAAFEDASPAFPHRFHCLHCFTALFRDHHIPLPSAADLAFLRDLLNSDSEPLIHRVYCGFTLGHLMWRRGDNRAAAKSCRHAIALAESASAEDRLATTMVWDQDKPIGDLLCEALWSLRKILAVSERPRVPLARTDVNVPFGLSVDGDAAQQDRLREAIIDRALHVPGSACDMCGTSAGTDRLKYCARCKRVAYCSAACQRGAWAQHRPSCRPPRAFAAGDLVRIFGLTSPDHEVLVGTIVELRGPETGGLWRFVCIGSALGPGHGELIDGDSIVLVVPSHEREQLAQDVAV